jgi:excisionase family DNA binding protein
MATEISETHGTHESKVTLSPQRAFTIEEFCRCFGVGRTKVYEEIKLGRLRARKIGRRTIIATDDAEVWFRRLPLMKTAGGHGEVVS